MNEDIKEILFQLEIVARKHTIELCEDGSKIETMPASAVDELRLNNYSSKLLLNYITNLQEENQKLKSNQVKAFNKIKDYINGCNCEILEGHYSNDNHSNYWKMFKEILEDIKNNLKKYDNNDYVYIPAWREKELLRIEEENEKLNKILDELEKWLKETKKFNCGFKIKSEYIYTYEFVCKNILNKLTKLKNEVK